jgi:hypothetical protein
MNKPLTLRNQTQCTSLPVPSSKAPARYRFSFVPGVATSRCSPRGIHSYPIFASKWMSSSSANSITARVPKCSKAKRILAKRSMRSSSSSRAIGFGRFQAQSSSCSQRLTVSADASIPRLAFNWAASAAQLQRVRHQP